MNCCKCNVELKEKVRHLHDCAHGIPETHMSGSERFECCCGYVLTKEEAISAGFKYVLDKELARGPW